MPAEFIEMSVSKVLASHGTELSKLYLRFLIAARSTGMHELDQYG
jgi:hypothetical protein